MPAGAYFGLSGIIMDGANDEEDQRGRRDECS